MKNRASFSVKGWKDGASDCPIFLRRYFIPDLLLSFPVGEETENRQLESQIKFVSHTENTCILVFIQDTTVSPVLIPNII